MRVPLKNIHLRSDAIDTIVFDFDGTLAGTLESSLLTLESTLLQFHIALPKPVIKDIYGSLSVEGMFRYVVRSDKDLLSKMICRYNVLYREIAPIIASLFPGVRSTLNLLKDRGFGLAIATNELRENLDMLLTTFGIDHIFDTTCCADEVKHPKPWPDMGKTVIEQLGAPADRTLMVGDSVCDIEMAQQNGMKSCAVSWGGTPFHRLIESSPEWAITDFSQLIDILYAPHRMVNFHSVSVNGTDRITETIHAY
jgi:phosphoglycolate phosphatase